METKAYIQPALFLEVSTLKMRKEQKIELVNSIAAEIKESAGVIITNYKGLTFDQMDEIRRSFKSAGNDYRVIKNTLLKKALNAENINDIDYTLVEPTALVVVKEDFAAAAKLAKKYAKDAVMSKFFVIKGGYFDGMALDQNGVEKIADLPSREELLAKALGSMNAPITNFVSVLANIPRGLVNVLNALKIKKENEQ